MTCTDILEELRTDYLQRVTRKVRSRLPRDCRRLAYIRNMVTCVLQLIDLHNQTFQRSEYDFSSGEPTGDREHTN